MTRRPIQTALAVLLLLTATGPASASLCDFADIAIFGLNSAHISKDATVTGNVVANSESPGPVLDNGAEVALDRNAAVTGDVSGHTIHLDTNASISGETTCVEAAGALASCTTIAAPPYTDVPEFQTASPGGDDVVVGPGETVILGDETFCSETGSACNDDADCTGGSDLCVLSPVTVYGDILISAGGTVVFSGGRDFDVNSIGPVAGGGQCPFPCRSIEFDAPTNLRVAGRIDTEQSSYVGPAAGSGIAASDIVIYGGGVNGGAGGPLDEPFAVNIGRESTVEANIYAPFGTIEIDKDSTATGAFLALDVEIQTRTDVFEDSAFLNEPPIAEAQEVQTDGANALLITLEGSDPEGGDVTFSIEVDPAKGTLGGITTITPPPTEQCSQSGDFCTVDADCPGFAQGETCETVQPPVTQATVTYTPTAANCVTEPESGAVTCAEDFFTFGVTDDCGDLATAIVSVNGGTDEIPDDPGSGVDVVEANDKELNVVVSQVRTITLSAAAPATVASLTFRVETLPSGALQDSNGASVLAGVDLPSPVLTYQAPAATGSDPFTYSARDSSTTAPPCGPPSCDTGTVNIDVGNLPKLAPNRQLGTGLNTPLRFTLTANSGGTGGGQAQLGGAMSLTYGDNGPAPTADTLSRLAALRGGADSHAFGGQSLAPAPLPLTALPVDQGWQQFSWCDEATAGVGNCFIGPLVDLVNEAPVIEGPFDFSITEASCLRVTDTLAKGDHWRVQNFVGASLDWTDFTSEVDQSTVGTTGDPDVAFGDLTYSHGEFELSGQCTDQAGAPTPCVHSVTLTTIPPDSFVWGTAGFIRVDTGPCVDIVWTITSLPTNGILTNLDGSAVQIGATYLSGPPLVYTPLLNISGPDSFTYQVAEGGTVGLATVDTAIVALLVAANDPCILVGRDPGCSPLQGAQAQAAPAAAPAPSDEAADEAGSGRQPSLVVIVEGDAAGSVASSRRETRAGSLPGLSCDSRCGADFAVGAEVVLFARPIGDDSAFSHWSGDCSGSEPITTVRVGRKTVCRAVFEASR